MCVFIFSQERGHPYSRHFSCAGHSGQTADLAVHLPAADLWRAGALPVQTFSLPRFQEQWWVYVVVIHCFLFLLKQKPVQNVCYMYVFHSRVRAWSRTGASPAEQLHARDGDVVPRHRSREELWRLHHRDSPGNGYEAHNIQNKDVSPQRDIADEQDFIGL